MNIPASPKNDGPQTRWLDLARANAAAFNDTDEGALGRAVARLAALAAAAHRTALLDSAPNAGLGFEGVAQ